MGKVMIAPHRSAIQLHPTNITQVGNTDLRRARPLSGLLDDVRGASACGDRLGACVV